MVHACCGQSCTKCKQTKNADSFSPSEPVAWESNPFIFFFHMFKGHNLCKVGLKPGELLVRSGYNLVPFRDQVMKEVDGRPD